MAQANEARNKGTMDKGPMDKASEMAQNVAQNAGRTVNDTFESVKNRTQEALGQAAERAGQTGDRVQAWANQTFDSASDSMKGFGKEVTDVVRKYPLPALVVGFGIGLLCGRIMKM